MKFPPLLAIVVLLSMAVPGCALFATKPLTGPGLQGRLDDNTYTSPGESFRFRIPWLSAKASLRDETADSHTVLVTIADDLCRKFIVSQRPGYLDKQPLEAWVDEHIIKDLKRLGFEVRSQSLMTRNGLAMTLRYRAPAAAPCRHSVFVNGKEVTRNRDADVGWYIYHRDGMFFRLMYVVGIGPGSPDVWYVKREPVDEVLAHFAEGFEILGAKDEPRDE